ncbi:MAG: hypothetical protein GX591_05635, partial [Planctomycetes bacterium]|nr:hypothetical protein [Planctomycetota bacterium]
MTDPGYTFDAQTTERLAAVVRRVEASGDGMPPGAGGRRGGGARKLFYRIVTNDTGGAYTLRRQAWDPATAALVDVADADDIEYGLDVDGYDFAGRGTGVENQRVSGWKLWVNDAWVTLIDVGEMGQAPRTVKV